MDLPHIIVTYTYVSFVKTISTNVHSACLPTVRKNEIDILSMVVVSSRCHHTTLYYVSPLLLPLPPRVPRARAEKRKKIRRASGRPVKTNMSCLSTPRYRVQMKIILRFRLSANQSITMRSPCANELIRSARSRISNPTRGSPVPTRVKIPRLEISFKRSIILSKDILKMENSIVFDHQVFLMLIN